MFHIHLYLFALILVTTSFNAAAAGATITTRVGDGFGDARVNAQPGSKVFGIDPDTGIPDDVGAYLAVFVGGSGIDVFGITKYRTTGNFDPYNAFSVQLTNLKSDPQPIGIQVFSDIVATGSPNTIELYLEAEVADTNNDGNATLTGGTAFAGAYSPSFSLVPFADNNTSTLSYGAATIVIDVNGPGPDFAAVGAATVDQIFMAVTGVLSPGDTLELNGFQCIYEPGGGCPEPPGLRFAAVPLPAPALLFLSGAVMLVERKRQPKVVTSTNYGSSEEASGHARRHDARGSRCAVYAG